VFIVSQLSGICDGKTIAPEIRGTFIAPVTRMNQPPAMRAPIRYRDRREAGHVLADRLRHFAGRQDVIVLALPRGGVPVAFEVAKAIGASLDVFIVRKLGLPGHPEFAMGAIASGGVRILDDDLVRYYRIPSAAVEQIARVEQQELERREGSYRGTRAPLSLEDRIVILVDDGLATGSTMRAAILAVRRRLPSQIVAAAPVGARQACDALNQVADEVVCPMTPEPFRAVGPWYQNFEQTTDEEVRWLLAAAAAQRSMKQSA
jgi:predicted phosphoribosyltransferase